MIRLQIHGYAAQPADRSQDEAIAHMDRWAAAMSNDPDCRHNHAFALGSVLFSLYLFIKHANDPESAVLTAVNGGGDTDTIAEMTGSLCELPYGASAFFLAPAIGQP